MQVKYCIKYISHQLQCQVIISNRVDFRSEAGKGPRHRGGKETRTGRATPRHSLSTCCSIAARHTCGTVVGPCTTDDQNQCENGKSGTTIFSMPWAAIQAASKQTGPSLTSNCRSKRLCNNNITQTISLQVSQAIRMQIQADSRQTGTTLPYCGHYRITVQTRSEPESQASVPNLPWTPSLPCR